MDFIGCKSKRKTEKRANGAARGAGLWQIKGVGASILYAICRVLARIILALPGRLRVLHPEPAGRPGAWLLAANHISHFDPPLIAMACRRRVDWMAMVELFRRRGVAALLRALGAFPADRAKVDRQAVRETLRRLAAGRVVGIFPEGGIRSGAESVLEGAPMRPGVATLARLAGVPVVPCVILGSDRLYRPQTWLPWPRTDFWIAFGEPLTLRDDLPPAEAREELEAALAAAWKALGAELRSVYRLTDADRPRTAQERIAE